VTRRRPHERPTAAMGGAAGLVFTAGCEEAQALARAVRARHLRGVEDVVPAADSVGILVDPAAAAVADVLELAAGLRGDDRPGRPKKFDLDVCFDGPDCGAVAEHTGLSVEEVIAALAERPLSVAWLGFMPGFPYLNGLREPLASVPRLGRPRVRVPAGAFAIAGGYAGIYPRETPGGWNVLGRTARQLFDPGRPEPATFNPGDLVQVRPVEALTLPADQPEGGRQAVTASGGRRCSVIEAGALTLVQDRGRIGVAHLGVPRAGPADPLRHLIANIAVGNSETCAALEVTLTGPRLRFGCDAFVALVGDCPLLIDGRAMPPATVQLVERGQTVSVGAVRRSLHAYLAISGGIEVPAVLGSRSTDATSGLWPGPLRAGDELDLGRSGRARGRWFEPPTRPAVLRVEVGPDGAGSGAGAAPFAALLAAEWEVALESDRVGTRLRPREERAQPGTALQSTARPAIASRATVIGAVQLPPDGCPIVLGPDHGTVGGYPVVAVVSCPSLTDSGQLRPGASVTFEEAGMARTDALTSWARRSVAGWMSTELDGGS